MNLNAYLKCDSKGNKLMIWSLLVSFNGDGIAHYWPLWMIPQNCHWTSGRLRAHTWISRRSHHLGPGWCQGSWPWTATTRGLPQRRWTCALLTESGGLRTATVASETLVRQAAHLHPLRTQERRVWKGTAPRSEVHYRDRKAVLLANGRRINLPSGFH